MLTPSLRNKVSSLWDKFWSGGISNPLNAIEQITYLLFMKQLDENDLSSQGRAEYLGTRHKSVFDGNYLPPGAKEGDEIDKQTLRWTYFRRIPAEEMLIHVQTKVFPFIRQLGDDEHSFFSKHMANAVFIIPKPSLLSEAVNSINDIYDELKAANRFIDAQGDLYEYLLQQLSQAGKNGQFRTPTHIIEMIVELVQPKLGDKIADPACGTAGFLLGAYKYMVTELTSEEYREPDDNGFIRGTMADKLVSDDAQKILNEQSFYGFDIDPTMIRIGLMNLMMHGIKKPQIDYTDTLSKNYNEDNIYNIVIANPPFTGSIDEGDLNKSFSIDTKKSELLFVERIYKMLRIGGTAGVVVPQGVLFGSQKSAVDLRRILIDQCELKAVINMPSGVFKPYAGVATAVLIFTKGGETKHVWYYDMESDGRSLDDKRNELFESDGKRDFGDVHKIIAAYHKRSVKKETDRKAQHFFVPRKDIEKNKYNLSINLYKEEVYEEVVYDPPHEILERLIGADGTGGMEKEITDGLNELKNMIGEN